MKFLSVCWMALLCAGQIAFAQSPSTREGDLAVHWEHHNIESGLTSQFVRDALLDRDGFLWVATAKGLNRFDSQTFTAHGPTVSAQSLSLDPSGDLWIGASGRRDWVRIDSIPRLQPHTLETLPSLSLPNITNPHCMRTRDGLWVTGNGGEILRLEGSEWTLKATLGDSVGWIEPLYHDPRKGTWFLWHHRDFERGAGLIHFNGTDFQVGPADHEIEWSLHRGAFHWRSNGLLTVIGSDHQLETRGPSDRVQSSPSPIQGLTSGNCFLSENPYTGHAWVLSGNRLVILNSRDEVVWDEAIAKDPEWASHIAKVVFTSSVDGWVCTNRGLTHIEVRQTGFYSEPWLAGVPSNNRMHSLRKMLEWSPDSLLLCNDHGRVFLSHRTDSGWQARPLLEQAGSGLCNIGRLPGDSLAVLTGEQWIEGPIGGPFTPRSTTGIVDVWSMHALEDAGQNWLIGHHGLSRYSRSSHRIESLTRTPEDRDRLGDVYAMARLAPGTHLIGTTTGLYTYHDANRQLERVSGLPEGLVVQALHVAGGHWWIGTAQHGLVRYDAATKSADQIDTKDGLTDQRIYAVLEDACGNLWLASDRGLMRYQPASGAVDVFGRTEGLKQLEFNRTSSMASRTGHLYFGGLEGLLKVDPGFWDCQSYDVKADIGLIALDAYGPASDAHEAVLKAWARGERIALAPDQAILRAEWRLLEWGPGSQSYATRIVGQDEVWHESTSNALRIAGLDPGDYELQVRARFRSGAWSKNALVVPFRVEPSLTQTAAFRVGVAVLALLLIWFIIRQAQLRTQRLERLVAERTASLREAIDLKDLYLKEVHHRVKNNMQIVGNLLDLQTAHVQHEEAIRTLREGRSRIASIALVHQELHQAGETKSLSFQHFATRLFDLSRQLFGWNPEDATLSFTGVDTAMDLDTAIPTGLILNELITNTFKHCDPDADRIAVEIHLRQLRSGRYSAFYDDHGRGLPEDANFSDDHSIGLWLIAEMVRKLGGSVHVSRRTRSRLVWTFEEPNPLIP